MINIIFLAAKYLNLEVWIEEKSTLVKALDEY